MKTLVVYSSLTGNTQYIAQGIYEALSEDKELCAVEDIESLEDFDQIILGYWVDKGGPDKKASDLMKAIKGKKVGLFATLGAYPDSDHARTSLERGLALVEKDNEVIGSFICQGRIAEALKQRMEILPEGHPHYPDEKRRKRWADADGHPNEEDVRQAVKVFCK